LASVHERREYYLTHPDEVRQIIAQGNDRAKQVAEATMDEVRRAVNIDYGL
jgi:tryptophanyl-tRNA synthetase